MGPFKMRCKICGNTFKRPPQNMKTIKICSKCQKLSINEQIKILQERQTKNFEFQNMINDKTKIFDNIKTTKAKTNHIHIKNEKLEKTSAVIEEKKIEEIIHEEKYEKENEVDLEKVRKRIPMKLSSYPETLTKFEQIEKYIQLLPKNEIENVQDYLRTL